MPHREGVINRIIGKGLVGLALMAVMLPGVTHAVDYAGTCPADWTLLLPDGRIKAVNVSSVTDLFGKFGVDAARSYCFEAFASSYVDYPSMWQLNTTAACIDADPASIGTEWVPRGATPPHYGNDTNTLRYCGIAPAQAQIYYRVRSFSGSSMEVSASETTLFNPRWSTCNDFLSSWGFMNTTPSTTINGLLSVNDGTNTYTKSLSIPPERLIYVFSSESFDQGLIGANKAGSAWFAHDGPPGSIRGDCYYAKSPVMVPSSFEPVRAIGR